MTYVSKCIAMIAMTGFVVSPASGLGAQESHFEPDPGVASGAAPAAGNAATPAPQPASAEPQPASEQATPGDAAAPAQTPSAGDEPAEPDREHRERGVEYDPEIDQLMAEFLSTSREIANRPGGEAALLGPGPGNEPNWAQALVVTHAANPLLREECKKEALQLSLDSLREAKGLSGEQEALRMAAAHLREHQEFVRSHRVSYAGYLKEVAECRAFCGPLVASLMRCQVLSVARSVHGIVLFDLDSAVVSPQHEQGVIENTKNYLDKSGSTRVVLIGRASKIGDLKYNRRLAAQRALAVRDSLLARGVGPERIETMWFGWEPPQISKWVAEEYGMEDLFHERGPLDINQSVMLVVYEPTSA